MQTGVVIEELTNFDQRCSSCNSFIIYDFSVREQNGECIPLELNHKHHFCRSAHMIVHECGTVNRLLEIVEDANNKDLISFRLELKIVDR
jgi:hypothetical protein